ncbi:MAG: rod shape-determining protein MreC [Deltaproteobacteria bacterium]|jgi:rod shape-determining protein MreC|nr:rod shape-determining protein MreC [Deltaproteobacteria bacterium]
MPPRFKAFSPLFLFLLALALMSAYARNPKGPTSEIAQTLPLMILAPVNSGLNYVADEVENVWLNYFALLNANAENQSLKQTVTRLRRRVVELEEDRKANERYQVLLNLKAQNPKEFLAGRILAWDPGPWFQAVAVDLGSRDGVTPEAAVFSDQGLVGRVVELAPNAAKVLLVTDRSSGVDAFIQRNRVNVLVTGLGAGRLELEYVRKGEDVRLGDLVVSSGLDGIFPEGLAIGVISQVDNAGLGIFLRAELRPSVDFSSLKEILIRPTNPSPFDWTQLGPAVLTIFEKKVSRPRSR